MNETNEGKQSMELDIRKRYGSWFISAGVAVTVILWLVSGQFGSDSDAAESAAASQEEAPVERTKVRVRVQSAEEVTRTITVNGRTAPARIVELASETDGRVVSIGGARGTRIETGGIIVRLDERDRSARLSQARATVKQRELDYQARLDLKQESYVSDTQLQEAVAALETARAELKRAELDLEYMVIRAPFDGALQERHVEIGDYVSTGDPVASFVDERTLIVTGGIAESDAHLVKKGSPGTAHLITGETVEGRIRYIAPVANESTRTFTVELELDNTAGDLKAGVTTELRIPAETIYAQKISPALLTLDDAGNLGLKTVNDVGRVEFHRADIALSSSDGVWIAGLPERATIITVGQGFVNDGALVDTVSEGDVGTAVAAKTTGEED